MSHKVLFSGLLATGMVVVIGCGSQSHTKEKFGHFNGKVVAEWLKGGRAMKLTQDFAYTDSTGKQWNAPAGSIVDGASIPKAFWSIIGGPFDGKYRDASVVHDVACQKKEEPWQDVHLMFYNACRCGGVDEKKAKLMYWAVYLGGPRWVRKLVEQGKPVYETWSPPIENFSDEQLQKMKKYMETNNPSLEELRALKPDSLELGP